MVKAELITLMEFSTSSTMVTSIVVSSMDLADWFYPIAACSKGTSKMVTRKACALSLDLMAAMTSIFTHRETPRFV
jgi:hypothetical protein